MQSPVWTLVRAERPVRKLATPDTAITARLLESQEGESDVHDQRTHSARRAQRGYSTARKWCSHGPEDLSRALRGDAGRAGRTHRRNCLHVVADETPPWTLWHESDSLAGRV